MTGSVTIDSLSDEDFIAKSLALLDTLDLIDELEWQLADMPEVVRIRLDNLLLPEATNEQIAQFNREYPDFTERLLARIQAQSLNQ